MQNFLIVRNTDNSFRIISDVELSALNGAAGTRVLSEFDRLEALETRVRKRISDFSASPRYSRDELYVRG